MSTIRRYYDEQCRDHGRGLSWEHCYGFFQEHWGHLLQVRDDAALQLGFYLASWGMYRGSSFLLKHDYTVHRPVIDALASDKFSHLWQRDVGTHDDDRELAATIMELVESVENAYEPFKPTDVLITKVLLGTVGCLPARDTFFEQGFKAERRRYGRLNRDFVDNILQFCIDHRLELAEGRRWIIARGGRPYPLMKLVDMHFWQIGYGRNSP